MEAEASFSSIALPVFNGNNYQIWAVCMENLEALDLWETVKEDYDILALLNNPTMAQIKAYKEKKKMKKSKAKACLFAVVSPTIFTRVMSLKTAKAIRDYLKQEYAEDERMKGMQVLNLIRDLSCKK